MDGDREKQSEREWEIESERRTATEGDSVCERDGERDGEKQSDREREMVIQAACFVLLTY